MSLFEKQSAAFYNCTGLTSVTIPDSVTSIGVAVFKDCTGLTSVTIGSSVTSISDTAFYNCTGLTSITIPNGVTSIGDRAFYNCTGLTKVKLCSGVTSIGDYAFAICTSLTGVYSYGNAPSIGSGVFDSSDNVTVYYLPGTTGWSATFASRPTVLWISPIIKANGFPYDITISHSDNLSITVQLNPGELAETEVDWWVIACANGTWFYMDSVVGWTQASVWHPVLQCALFNLPATPVLNMSGLGTGLYTFYFAVDYPMDGILNVDGQILVDSVNVTVE